METSDDTCAASCRALCMRAHDINGMCQLPMPHRRTFQKFCATERKVGQVLWLKHSLTHRVIEFYHCPPPPMKYTCISTSGSISAQGPQDQLPWIKLTGDWDQMACNGNSTPSKSQRRGKDTSLSPSVWIREQLKMKDLPCVQGQGASFMSEEEGGGWRVGGWCYFCTARRWWWPVCVLVGKRKGEVKGK